MLDRALTTFARIGAQTIICSGVAAYFHTTLFVIATGVFTWVLVEALLDVALQKEPSPPEQS